jgi:osmoprotectant transport system ATP-binding protein
VNVEFQDVSFGRGDRIVLRDASFELRAGETLVLLGASGSGKTTALKLVNGLLLPAAGEVLVDGKPTTAWDRIALRRKIGYVIQEGGVFPHMTVAENVGIVPRLLEWPEARIRERVEFLLGEVQLPAAEFASRYPRELSGGQRQRVGVARALAADPGLLLFDEPFGALDPVTRLGLQRQFLALRERYRTTALFVTHDIGEALRLGTRVGLLDNGRLEALATVSEFRKLDHPMVRAFMASLET